MRKEEGWEKGDNTENRTTSLWCRGTRRKERKGGRDEVEGRREKDEGGESK